MNYLLAIIGLIIFVLLNIMKASRTHGKEFKVKIFLKDNQWTFYVSLACVVGLMLAISDIIDMFAVYSKYIKAVSLMIGFTNYSFFKFIMDILWKKKFKKDMPTIDIK